MCSFQNTTFTPLRAEFSSCHKQLLLSFFLIQGPFQMSGPLKYNTTGLWTEKNTAQRAEKKS